MLVTNEAKAVGSFSKFLCFLFHKGDVILNQYTGLFFDNLLLTKFHNNSFHSVFEFGVEIQVVCVLT